MNLRRIDDWRWINREEIKASRRALKIKWSIETMEDFKRN